MSSREEAERTVAAVTVARDQQCEDCGIVGPLVAHSAQFDAVLCSSCLADRYPQNGAGPDAELLGGRVDLIQLISEGSPTASTCPAPTG